MMVQLFVCCYSIKLYERMNSLMRLLNNIDDENRNETHGESFLAEVVESFGNIDSFLRAEMCLEGCKYLFMSLLE